MFFIGWLVLAGCCAAYANSKHRSGTGWFFLALLFSPLLMFIVLACLSDPQKSEAREQESHEREQEARALAGQRSDTHKKCKFCAEAVRIEALKCKHCGSDLTFS
jgi:hypothetical protein